MRPLIVNHGNGKMEQIHRTLESTLKSVDEAEAIAVEEANKVGFDEDEQHQIGMAVRNAWRMRLYTATVTARRNRFISISSGVGLVLP